MAIEATNALLKRGKKKNIKVNQFNKKEYYSLHTPAFITQQTIGNTLVKPHNSSKILERRLFNRSFEIHENAIGGSITRKYKFMVNKLIGTECHSVFNGMQVTSDRRGEIAKRWHTLIDAVKDVELTDGYKLRFEIAATTKKPKNSTKQTCYAKMNEVRELRHLMFEEVEKLSKNNIEEVINKLKEETISKTISKKSTLLIQDCCVLKVKVIKNPFINN